MSGYTPIFSTMLEGTLYGRWPHTGIWGCLLSQMSREGVIDKTPQCLASAIGVPVDVLIACINDFMQPDPDSRTPDNDGRRLELIDSTRSWGWRVLNAQKYREKARKKTYDADRTASGADAERKRQAREKEGAKENVPTRPAKSRRDPLSDTYINSNKEDMSTSSTTLVFEHWKTTFNHPRSVLDSKRERIIDAALKNFTVDEVCQSITGYRKSPWHMGKNDRKRVFDGIELILRDAKHIEDGIAFASQPEAQQWT